MDSVATPLQPSEDDILTAYHEAGHAVVALALGRPVLRVSIIANATRLGQCELKKGRFKPSKDALETEVLILLAGLVAEGRLSGRYARGGAARDLRQARLLTGSRAGSDRQAERLERRMLDKTEHLLHHEGHWTAVQRIAAELLQHQTISGRAARHHFEQALASAS